MCRDLEQKYNLQKATEQEQKQTNKVFKPVDYKNGDIKRQIASVVRHLLKYYSFPTLGSYNALLSLFNITAEEVKGERNGQPVNGLVYVELTRTETNQVIRSKHHYSGKMQGLHICKSTLSSPKRK